jgi:FixJ family two-component response regulator
MTADADQAAGAAPTALVLDDEEGLREIVCRVLRRAGFTALATGTPEEAIAAAQLEGQRIDVLVTDLGLPTAFGAEVARRLTADRPGLPVVFISGLAKTDAVSRGLLDDDARLVQKPFRRESLLDAVRAALAGEPPPDVSYPGG